MNDDEMKAMNDTKRSQTDKKDQMNHDHMAMGHHGNMDHMHMDHDSEEEHAGMAKMQMEPGSMDHAAMDQMHMNHGAMDHMHMDHGSMDHGRGSHDAYGKSQAKVLGEFDRHDTRVVAFAVHGDGYPPWRFAIANCFSWV
ncbi:putative copper-transporting P-type ATPase B [Lacticaseibacillus paracasei subsp. paracasei Lpp125]|nr:putative copper-transporting P-type ATPase B [Lacticaseibacillus paracasei subsp. paracasei Lpp125]